MKQYGGVNNPGNGTTRISPDALSAFNSIEGCEDPKEILDTIAAFIGKATKEVYSPTRFSDRTGEPIEFDWIGAQWDGKVWIGATSNGVSVSDDVYRILGHAGIIGIAKPTVSWNGDKPYSVRYVKGWDSGGERGGYTPHHFVFEEMNPVDFDRFKFIVTDAEIETGLSADYVTLITDIKHPGYKDKTLRITIRVTPKTGEKWIRDTFGIESR